MAALIAVRLKKFLFERMEISFERVCFYTDSMITYHWVTSENPGCYRQFVANRIREIQENSARNQWFHCSGEHNVADSATRGVSAADLVQDSAWWNGPEWLSLPDDQKPISQPRFANPEVSAAVTAELRRTVAPIVRTHSVIDLERFRSARHACRVLARVLQFVSRCRGKEINVAESYREAELRLIAWSQSQHFPEEMALTRTKERIPASSKLTAFNLEIDGDGLLRVKTRLTRSMRLSRDETRPIILPGESLLTKLLVIDAHRQNAHFGVDTVLSYLRRRFWITRGRQVIKSIIHRCVVCRKKHARHANQIEAPLPAVRVDLQTPFCAAGVDFCGPYFTKHRDGTLKTYVALFPCTTTRPLHLEAVPSMTAPQTGLAIRRFLAAYPSCKRFISDNGRSFVKAAADLEKIFKAVRDRETQEILQSRLIQWDFNCPRAPAHGGFFERLVGTVKSALFKTLGRSLIGYEEFRTILNEVCSVINNRPLTYVSNDCDEPTAITPAHFLTGGPSQMPIAGIAAVDELTSDKNATAAELRRATQHRTTYLKNLSVRWFRECLLLLRTANLTRDRVHEPIGVGEVCLLHEDNKPRIKWKLVRVVEQHRGRDGNVRVYSIRTPNGKVTRRAAQLLYPLEVREEVSKTAISPNA